jgi:DNA-binding response OmpR family regulator
MVAGSQGVGDRPLVLVVDDDQVICELLKLHLVNAGYRVLTAGDGISGGHLILNGRPDLVIVDVDMPYMGGYELVEAVKADATTSHVPVIFLSSREDVGERSAKLGAEAYLKKPIKADSLLEVVALYSPSVPPSRSS